MDLDGIVIEGGNRDCKKIIEALGNLPDGTVAGLVRGGSTRVMISKEKAIQIYQEGSAEMNLVIPIESADSAMYIGRIVSFDYQENRYSFCPVGASRTAEQ